jgi:hypothetical protein
MTDPAVTPDREPEPEPEPPPTIVAALTMTCLANDLRIAYAASESAAEQIALEDMLESAAKLRDRLHRLPKDAPRIAPGAESGGLS